MVQSYLLASKSQEKINQKLEEIREREHIDPIDAASIESEKSVGIEQVRDVQHKLFLKPIKSKTKLLVINASNEITVEAQNALLKILEEPPDHTIIVLAVPSRESVLPTILSRCTVIETEKQILMLSEKEAEEFQNMITKLLSGGVGEKLKIAQDYGKTREDALSFLEKLILAGRQMHLEKVSNPNNKSPITNNIVASFQKTYTIIKTTNVSPRFALENLFLSL
ncbi:MAG TPA: hypothetical protein VLF68_03355 [Candidatus Saccharimonadales bacterium]|nr:hypothetical protein [Candidatus Saccharimonadales bacterium]